MSKIHVELARSIDPDNALHSLGHASKRPSDGQKGASAQPAKDATTSLKRKYEGFLHDGENPKLEEYLKVMQPASKSRTWANEEPTGIKSGQQDLAIEADDQAISVNQGSDAEVYQEVPTKKRKAQKEQSEVSIVPTEVVPDIRPPELVRSDADAGDTPTTKGPETPPTTDDDWLRSRTSRLLGLIDDDDSISPNTATDNAEPQGGQPSTSAAESSRLGSGDAGNPSDADVLRKDDQTADESNGTANATNRLFIRNLPYTATEGDICQHLERHQLGKFEEVIVPINYQTGNNKGFVYVQYSDLETAAKAMQELDGKIFQGRLLHVIYSAPKRQSRLDEIAISKLPLKKQQQIRRKAEAASSTFNWNSMYMNADAVMSSISERLGISKSELLDPTSADAGVKQAHAETHVIQETKAYFSANGVNLDAFKRRDRGDSTILVKNFSYGTKAEELQKLFEAYGTIRRLLMPSSGTIAIVEFAQVDHARTAFRSLAYRKFKESVLFLEKAPKDLFTGESVAFTSKSANDGARGAKQSAPDLFDNTNSPQVINTSTLFVRNLNFSTTTERLREVFKPLDGFMSARVKTKPDPKTTGKLLSMGFGFLEFRTKEQAQAALAAMDGHSLDGHELLIRASHRGADAAEERRREDTAKKAAGRRTKIVIKNLPFEASKKDVRSLLGSYGQLRSVRVPKKFDSSTRGFAFAEFTTAREAENAMDALKDTHLLGRRLVLDFAAEDAIDPEQEIAKMQQKAGKQADKVALQRLTGSGRRKFNVGEVEDIDRG
ncbi:MAG: hypothetical protein Q9219_002938 [cf. Caloplaca sp. 3 TL-2023]